MAAAGGLSIVACSWNVGDKPGTEEAPRAEKLAWLGRAVREASADILILGVQEFCPEQLKEWSGSLCEALPEGFELRLAEHGDTHMALFVLARAETVPVCALCPMAATGGIVDTLRYDEFEGKPAGKGCVACMLAVGSVALCIVNAHLHHGHSGFDRRNEQQQAIESRFARIEALPPQAEGLPVVLIEMGDLNHRILARDHEIFLEPTKSAPEGDEAFHAEFEKLAPLCEAGRACAEIGSQGDQLHLARTTCGLFQGFEEAPVTFNPTYKRALPYPLPIEGGGPPLVVYDRTDKRLPGWCDRVLWKLLTPGVVVKADSYDAVEEVTWTDHRPVVATLRLKAC
mmetsp:Transcript_29617/g.78428  ORF Transcript_29617/g.78428 Transcript_29617/m.78428 type:complete len:342 (+) Transcript_29617:106-1131(+)